FDVKQLTKGAKLFLPVFKEGGLFSTGDGHFAQGDGEVCVTAVEMGATAVVRFKVHKGLANTRKLTSPVFSRTSYFIDPRYAAPERFLGVMGMPINQEGEIEAENLTLACRNAVLNMMELLQEHACSREQAYVICSVAVDLRISNVVDVPNYVVSALLPEAIFGGDWAAWRGPALMPGGHLRRGRGGLAGRPLASLVLATLVTPVGGGTMAPAAGTGAAPPC